MSKLYCPHCNDFHEDSELILNLEFDYIKCKKTNQEIKTYKYTDSESTLLWRKLHRLE